MRNDLKIGMLVAASIVIVVVVYFVVTGGDGADTENAETDTREVSFDRTADEETSSDDGIMRLEDILNDDDELVRLDDEEDILGVGEIGNLDDEEEVVGDDDEDEIVGYGQGPIRLYGTDDDEEELEDVVTPPVGAMTDYVVKATDTGGFWDVSMVVYGSGKHWKLIEEANPDANTHALREGQIIKIPPLPTRAVTVERTGPALSEGTTADTRTYIVQADDTAGFWGISKKVYNGAGKYNRLIQEANPDVDSRTLRKGMKLIIPPLPVAEATPAGSGTTSGTTSTIDLPTGATTHTVVGGDSLWEIAKAYYGNGAFHYLIVEANPGVTATSPLQLKQVLIIPAKPASETVPAGSGGTGGSTPGVTRDPERPYFE